MCVSLKSKSISLSLIICLSPCFSLSLSLSPSLSLCLSLSSIWARVNMIDAFVWQRFMGDLVIRNRFIDRGQLNQTIHNYCLQRSKVHCYSSFLELRLRRPFVRKWSCIPNRQRFLNFVIWGWCLVLVIICAEALCCGFCCTLASDALSESSFLSSCLPFLFPSSFLTSFLSFFSCFLSFFFPSFFLSFPFPPSFLLSFLP